MRKPRTKIDHNIALRGMLGSLSAYKVEDLLRQRILEAYTSEEWDWKTSDGCTCVFEPKFLIDEHGTTLRSRFYPPCILHDFWCWQADQVKSRRLRNKIRARGDALFLEAMLAYHFFTPLSYVRFAGVRAYWLALRSWR